MPFIEVDGIDGLVYVPEEDAHTAKKHPCRDCMVCQHCSDARCRICLNKKAKEKTQLHLASKRKKQ